LRPLRSWLAVTELRLTFSKRALAFTEWGLAVTTGLAFAESRLVFTG
jgi:hypothetical protein